MTITIKPQTVSVSVNPQSMGISVGNPVIRDYAEDRDPYAGSYTITPSIEEQILLTENLRMTGNLIVEPIPQNYGLITWDGATLTVS